MSNEELFALVKKNPISFGCGLVSLVLVGLIYFRSGEIPAIEAELAQKSAEGERHALNIKNAKDLKEQYEALVAANKEVDARAVRESQRGANAEFFFKLESESGVKLLDARQTGQVASKGKSAFSSVAFSVSAQGEMPQLLKFLHRLESGVHYCRVMNASLTVAGTKRDAPLTMTLSLELLGVP